MTEGEGQDIPRRECCENTLAVIAARSGSKGLPNKNIMKLLGVPLLGWSIAFARLNRLRVIVSTDSEEYAEIARECGAQAPHLRSKELSGDRVDSVPVVLDALDTAETLWDRSFNYVVLLEPTSPLRSAGLLQRAWASLAYESSDRATSVVSVARAGNWHPDFALMRSQRTGTLVGRGGRQPATRRQETDEVFFPDGSLYLSTAEALRREKSFFQENMPLLEVGRIEAIDIDDLADFNFCQVLAAALTEIESPPFDADFAWLRDINRLLKSAPG